MQYIFKNTTHPRLLLDEFFLLYNLPAFVSDRFALASINDEVYIDELAFFLIKYHLIHEVRIDLP